MEHSSGSRGHYLGPMDARQEDFDAQELRRHSEWLRNLARGLVGDDCTADDLAQDAWHALASRRRRRVRKLRPFLAGVVRNLASKRARSEARRVRRERATAKGELLPSSAELVERLEIQRIVVEELQAMGDPRRTTILLHYFEGLSSSKIAQRQGVPPSTVRVRLKRGLDELRGRLDRRLPGRTSWRMSLFGLPAFRSAAEANGVGALSVTASTTANVLGSTLVNKYMASAMGVLVLGFGTWGVLSLSGVLPRPSGASDPLAENLLSPEETKAVAQPAIEPPREDRDRKPVPANGLRHPDPAGPFGSLRVLVKWEEDGTPAANVGLLLRRRPSTSVNRYEEGVTGGDGRYHLENLQAGTLEVMVDRSREPGSRARVEIEPGKEAKVELTIPVGIDVEGIVVDGGGRPIANAEVQFGAHGVIQTTAMSSTDGRFRLRSVDRAMALVARAPGYAPSEAYPVSDPIRLAGRKAQITIELPDPGGSTVVVVKDPDGVPVADAQVSIGGRQVKVLGSSGVPIHVLPDGSWRLPPPPLQGRTDSMGRFSAVGVDLGSVPVTVRADGWPGWSGTVQVDAATTAWLQVRLESGVTLSGTIRREDEAPAEGIVVTATGNTRTTWTSTATDASGDYRLENVTPGLIEVHANHRKRKGLGSESTMLHTSPGAHLTWNATLPLVQSIVGQALDEQGAPLKGWSVTARSANSGQFLYASTDSDGRFRLNGCSDLPYIVELRPAGAFHEDMPSAWESEVRPGERELLLRVTAQEKPSSLLVGTLVASDGRPVEHAELWVGSKVLQGFYQRRRTDESTGRFELGPLSPGEYEISAVAKGFPRQTLGSFELAANETRDLGEVTIETPGFLHATVRTQEGQVPQGLTAHLWLTKRGGRRIELNLKEGGRIRSGPLLEKTYYLALGASGCATKQLPVDIRAGQESELEVTLDAGNQRRIEFPILNGATSPRGLWVVVRDDEGNVIVMGGALRNDNGTSFSFSDSFASGTYTVEASCFEGLSAKGVLVVETLEHQSTAVEMPLEK